MDNALAIVETMNLSYDDLQHLSERIEDLARIKKNEFWKQKLCEWYNLKGEFDIFREIYSTDTFENNSVYNSGGNLISFKIDDNNLLLQFEGVTHKPLDLRYNHEIENWYYDYHSRQIFTFENSKHVIITLKELYPNETETFISFDVLIKNIDILGNAIFNQ